MLFLPFSDTLAISEAMQAVADEIHDMGLGACPEPVQSLTRIVGRMCSATSLFTDLVREVGIFISEHTCVLDVRASLPECTPNPVQVNIPGARALVIAALASNVRKLPLLAIGISCMPFVECHVSEHMAYVFLLHVHSVSWVSRARLVGCFFLSLHGFEWAPKCLPVRLSAVSFLIRHLVNAASSVAFLFPLRLTHRLP